MSTSSRIGYLKDGLVTSISCHSDGYISFNGVLLHEHYKDIGKIKELIQSGNASHLGTKLSNTSFYKDEDEKAVVEPLSEYASCASYHYLFDEKTNQWQVYNNEKVALLSNAINNFYSFMRIEGKHFKNDEEAFKMCEAHKEAFSHRWQSWWTENSEYNQSIVDTDNMCVDVSYHECHKDNEGNFLIDDVHLYIPFKSLSEADALSDAVYGKTIDEIKKEFGEKIMQPSLDDKIEEAAEKVNEMNPVIQPHSKTQSFNYKGEF